MWSKFKSASTDCLAMGAVIATSGIFFTVSKSYREWFLRRNSAHFAVMGAIAGGVWILCKQLKKRIWKIETIHEIKFGKFSNIYCRGHIDSLSDCTERMSRTDPTFTCSFQLLR